MHAVHDGTANININNVIIVTRCSECKFMDANFNAEWIHCRLFDDWLRVKDAENEELTCEGYIDRLDDGRA